MLKITFRKHPLMKISMTYVYIKPEVAIKWFSSNGYSYKWNLHWVITWKLLFDEEGITLFIEEDENLVRRDLYCGGFSKFLATWVDSLPFPRFSFKVLVERARFTPAGQSNFAATDFWQERCISSIFCWTLFYYIELRDLILTSFFK